MNDLSQHLLKLQALAFGEGDNKNAENTIAELRGKVPPPILAHFDRLVARGKKGLAAVRNQVCTECHISIPIGTITTIMHGTDIQLCGNCGRYLYLPEPAKTEPSEPVQAVKPASKTRKRKVLVHAS